MGKKDLKRKVEGVLSSSSDVDTEIVSILQPTPNEEPIVKRFSSATSSGDIVEGTFQALENAGYIVEPKTLDFFVRTVDDIKDQGVGFKVGGNLSPAGGGASFEKSPGKQTETRTEKEVKISFEVRKKGK
jgi:hypothetical protein